MNHLRVFDYLTLSRRKVLDAARRLDDAQWRQQFDLGLGSVARTLTHIMISEWYYIERLEGRSVPEYLDWPIQDENPPACDVLEQSWTKQAQQTRTSIEAVSDWERVIEYSSVTHPEDTDAKPMIITATANDIVTQLVLHEVHHRAQVLAMLRWLGQKVEGDLDFNALMYEMRVVG